MDNRTIRCTNCGATCKSKDEYCKSCWKKIAIEAAPDDSIVDEVNQSEWVDWELFIDKNADRYIETYKKNQDKKIFAHINWSAFFFGLNWVLYRRMIKFAIISLVITSLLSLFLFTVFLIPYRADIKRLNEDIEPYEEYCNRGGKTILYDEQGVPYSPEIVQKGASAKNKLAKIETNAQLKCYSIIILLSCGFWGFLGDAVYKIHIKQNIGRKNGGTSLVELIGGRILLSVMGLLLSPITSLVIKIIF